MFCLILQTDSYLLLVFTGTWMNAGSPDSESLVWWLSPIFSQSDYGVTNQILTFIFPNKQNYSISNYKKDERHFYTLQYLSRRSQMEGWCCFVFWRVNLRATLAGKPQLFGVVWWFMTDSPSPGRSQTLLWPLPWSTSPPHTPSPSVLALSPRKPDLLSCVCSETGSPLGGTMKLQKKRIPPDLFINLQGYEGGTH